jgi:hypothetical protein
LPSTRSETVRNLVVDPAITTFIEAGDIFSQRYEVIPWSSVLLDPSRMTLSLGKLIVISGPAFAVGGLSGSKSHHMVKWLTQHLKTNHAALYHAFSISTRKSLAEIWILNFISYQTKWNKYYIYIHKECTSSVL